MITFNPLTATAAELQKLYASGLLTSVKVIDVYLDRIHRHNDRVNAVIGTAPRQLLLKAAQKLDEEKRQGLVRSRLHGIPVLVKGSINTHPDMGMDNSGGSLALLDTRPKGNALIVQQLIDAGALIIGKANLSELNNFKTEGEIDGYSAVGGQCEPVFVAGGIGDDPALYRYTTPAGSSTGSAVGVSIGFAPLAIGMETVGSIVGPAAHAAVYGLKPTVGLVSQHGLMPISEHYDSIGPMAKTVLDVADLLTVMVAPGDSNSNDKRHDYADDLVSDWSNIRVGAVDARLWIGDEQGYGVESQIVSATEGAYAKIKGLAKTFHRDVPLPTQNEVLIDGVPLLRRILPAGFKRELETYLAGLESTSIHTVQEIMDFNEQHADVELPPRYPHQKRLEQAMAEAAPPEVIAAWVADGRRRCRDEGIDRIMRDYDVDVIIGPWCRWNNPSAIAAGAGYPICIMPLGYLDLNGRPFAMAAVTKANREDLLIRVMSAWEATFPERRAPPEENYA